MNREEFDPRCKGSRLERFDSPVASRSPTVKISAVVRNGQARHDVTVSTADSIKALPVPPKAGGRGSSVNGGEFLMLALATCYCNDVYREAARLNLDVQEVEVEAAADFDGVGLAARNVRYRARIRSSEPKDKLDLLLKETDAVAEVQNTLRAAAGVTMVPWDAGV